MLDTNKSFLFCRLVLGSFPRPPAQPQEQSDLQLPPVRQIVSDKAQPGETFEIRVRRPEALRVFLVHRQIHPERQVAPAHAERSQHFCAAAKGLEKILRDNRLNVEIQRLL